MARVYNKTSLEDRLDAMEYLTHCLGLHFLAHHCGTGRSIKESITLSRKEVTFTNQEWKWYIKCRISNDEIIEEAINILNEKIYRLGGK